MRWVKWLRAADMGPGQDLGTRWVGRPPALNRKQWKDTELNYAALVESLMVCLCDRVRDDFASVR